MIMKVVIDTNVLVSAIYRNSKNYWIRAALQGGQLTIALTTDILVEYAEVLTQFYDSRTAELFISALELLPNKILVNKYFFWNLIPRDPDDEKFVDCAIAAGVDYLVTNDRHFNHLKKLPFPRLNIVNEIEFKAVFEESKN